MAEKFSLKDELFNTNLMIDYILYFKTKKGILTPKIHKLKKLTLEKGKKITLTKKHLFKDNMTTRTFYEGEHKIALQINGNIFEERVFFLRLKNEISL